MFGRNVKKNRDSGSNAPAIIVSENIGPMKRYDLASRDFEGIYELTDGSLMDAHEWEDGWFEDDEMEGDDTDPIGAVYYDIISKDGRIVDGGVLGYRKGEDITELNEFVRAVNHVGIVRRVVGASDSGYSEICNTIDNLSAHAEVRRRYGLRNIRSGRC